MTILLDLLIGLAVLYLLVAVAASFLAEALASLSKLRARGLEASIARLLEGQGSLTTSPWATNFYAHALVKSLKPGDGTRAPSYIPAGTYAATVLDLLRKTLGIAEGQPLDLPTLQKQLADPACPIPEPLRGALAGALSKGIDTVDALRKDLEKQFDAAMERASGWYKRHTQLILFVIALLLAGGFNLDSFYIAQRLLQDPQLRAGALELSRTINAGDGSRSADQFVANLRMQANLAPARVDAVKSLKPATEATRAGNLVALRDLHNGNHYNRGDADVDWQILTATEATREAAFTAAYSAESCPAPQGTPARPEATAGRCDWLNYVQSLKDSAARKEALDAFVKTRTQWCPPDRTIVPPLCTLIADAVRTPADAGPLGAVQTYLANYQTDAAALDARLGTVLSRLPKVGWIGDVWPRLGLISPFGWLATAFMAGFGAPFWFDLVGRLVSLRSAGLKPAAPGPAANP